MWIHLPTISCPCTPVLQDWNLESVTLSQLTRLLTVKGKFRASGFLLKELKKACLTQPLYTQTYPHSPIHFQNQSISSVPDSHANRGHGLTHQKSEEKVTNETDGPIPSGSFARYDPLTCSWKTSQISLMTRTLEPYSESWPKQGSMRNGLVSQDRTLTSPRSEKGFSFWPTPTRRDWKDGPSANYDYPTNGYLGRESPVWVISHSSHLPLPISEDGHRCGKKCLILNPRFVGWLQGFPKEWLSYKPMGTRLFRRWEHLLSEHLQKDVKLIMEVSEV